MDREGGNKEKIGKCRERIFPHFLIQSPFPLKFLILSPFPHSLCFLFIFLLSLHFLAARLPQFVKP